MSLQNVEVIRRGVALVNASDDDMQGVEAGVAELYHPGSAMRSAPARRPCHRRAGRTG
jgi:hypothetical protein